MKAGVDPLKRSAPSGTLSLGAANNIDLVIAKYGCFDCPLNLTSKVTINGTSYNDGIWKKGNGLGIFNMAIEPQTGFMISSEKIASVFINFKSS